jgi:hypothetical protein
MLFEYQKAYCVYYSSAEVMMLRSLGIPARLAVGFAQGQRDGDDYIVHRNDAHAWPEVYFPNVGWVEFEPTGSQPALNRPLPPRDPADSNNPLGSLNAPIPNDDPNFSARELSEEELDAAVQQPVEEPVNPGRYLIPLLVVFAALTIYFGRRYSVPSRLPGMLLTTYERTGIQTPNWLINWERWVNTSRIQRSFESINFALRLLKHPVPIDATPAERAHVLNEILPNATNHTRNLLDEHQTSLYTSQEADSQRARLAAFNIRKYALFEALRYVFEGRPIRNL